MIAAAPPKSQINLVPVQQSSSSIQLVVPIVIGMLITILLVIAARGGDLLIHIKTYLFTYTISFALMIACFALLRNFGRREFTLVFVFAIIFRIVMICAPPTLSDDIYRYVFDGRLSANGINPYLYRPDAPELVAFQDKAVFSQMSSGTVYSVYPPVSQAIFLLGFVTGHPLTAIKVVYSIFDLGIIILLWMLIGELGLPRRNIILYAWNPLPIYEFAGSGHTDATLLFFTLLAILLFARKRYFGSFTALGFAIISKLLPVIFLPYFFFAMRGRKRYYLAIWSGVVVILGYLPFAGALPTVVKNFTTDVGLYLSSLYIFNGSLYTFWYWVRDTFHIYGRFTDFGFMASALSILFGLTWLGIVVSAWMRRGKEDLPQIAWRIMLTFFAFLVCSPNVQIWYISWILCFVPIIVNFDHVNNGAGFVGKLAQTRSSWLTWSCTGCFAYIAYNHYFAYKGPFSAPAWTVWLEYGLMFGLLANELFSAKQRESSPKTVMLTDPNPAQSLFASQRHHGIDS